MSVSRVQVLRSGSTLSPCLREWLPGNHLTHFISDVVDELDMKKFVKTYGNFDRGQPPYYPVVMVKLLLYASRKIEQKTHEDIVFRFPATGDHPDQDAIATFRKTNLTAIKDCFFRVLFSVGKQDLSKPYLSRRRQNKSQRFKTI